MKAAFSRKRKSSREKGKAELGARPRGLVLLLNLLNSATEGENRFIRSDPADDK